MVVPPSTGGGTTPNPPLPTKSTPPNPANRLPNGIVPIPLPIPVPYSARRAQPLDMNTVERKGSQAAKEVPKRDRPHGLQEAPVYRPDEEEFRDPMAYIKKIAPEASKYGICKIIPPDSWNPGFAIDLERFHFRTRRQELNSVEGGTRANLNYLDQLAKFHKQYGTNLNRFPSVDKRPLDLYKLKKAVEIRGGFERVCKDKKWAEIGRDLGYSGKIMSSLSTSLKNSYQRWLHPYEEYLRTVKPGSHPPFDLDAAAPFPPSPTSTPMKKSESQIHSDGFPAESIMMPAIDPPPLAEKAEVAVHPSPVVSAPITYVEAPRPASSGFMAVNSGGFSAVNAPSAGFVAVNHAPPLPKREPESSINIFPPHVPVMNVEPRNGPIPMPSLEPAGPIRNGEIGSNPLKRTLSHESVNGDSASDDVNGDADGPNGRRSKRLKKDVPTVAGSHMTLMRPSTPRMRSRTSTRKSGDRCEQCNKSEDLENVIVCDACELGYHKHCLDPPLVAFPDYDWHCPRCLIGTGEYGFEEGGIYSLRVFQEKAKSFKENYFHHKTQFDPVLNGPKKETEDEVEREFWRLVESLTETVEVEYGADIHTTTHGSGFPTIEKHPLDPYSKDPWNLNVMPFHEESLFRHIKTDISGMTVPWLYVGMCFSTFCWHNEDHYTYSANYQHFGATKTWYGIPGADAHAFEEAMRQAVPELFESQPDLLFQLVTLLPPDQLQKAGVSVYALDQRAGQFVITFPQAYHAGFNHGFNLNEAVNFAPSDWEPFGQTGVDRLQEFRRQPCFSHDELLLTAAAMDSSIKTARWLAPALERMRDRELKLRESFWNAHRDVQEIKPDVSAPSSPITHKENHVEGENGIKPVIKEVKVIVKDEDLQEEEYQCQVCKAYSFLSQFYCQQSSKVSCLQHIESSECCSESYEQKLRGGNHTLKLRLSNDQLSDLVHKVTEKARVPEAWQEKLDRTLEDGPTPALKALHSLLAEGKKIPVDLPGLKDLGTFVKRCDQWVEEAEQYTTRKQQNRRKSEKTWKAKSNKNSKSEEKELTVEGLRKLLSTAEGLSFSHEKIEQLEGKLKAITDWKSDASEMLKQLDTHSASDIEALLELGRGYFVTMEEIDQLDKQLVKSRWNEEAKAARANKSQYTLAECEDLVKRGLENGMSAESNDILYFQDMVNQGALWEAKCKQVMAQENINYGQLEALWAESEKHDFPVNLETRAELDAVLIKNRAAKEQIQRLFDRTKAESIRDRPSYEEVRGVMRSLEDWTSKPSGSVDLEREIKRHEDWMRKGKKLFGKANAPLHILKAHMETVEGKNAFCFDLNDTFRAPVEPQSREASPVDGSGRPGLGQDEKSVFCICRQAEGGMMIECEVCQDWYHGKCLKIARGKVKGSETFTCPICDWRVKIPRDAARPKLEDLQQWQEEVAYLPFQPDEEEILDRIIDKAQTFRDFLSQYINGNQLVRTAEEMPTILFYLRKIEGAEVLLTYETNNFRQDVHKWQPVAPTPPPILEQSLSTRKPRPTKQQKMMKEHGVAKLEDLPPHLRKQQAVKRKSTGPQSGRPAPPPLQPAQGQRQGSASTPTGSAMLPSVNGAEYFPKVPYSPTYNSTHYKSRQHSPSPTLFSPTASLASNNGLREPVLSSYPPLPSGPADNTTMFSSGYNVGGDDDMHMGIMGPASNGILGASSVQVNGHVSDLDSSPHATNVDDMFMEMTNEEPDRDEITQLRHDSSHLETPRRLEDRLLLRSSDPGTREVASLAEQEDDFAAVTGLGIPSAYPDPETVDHQPDVILANDHSTVDQLDGLAGTRGVHGDAVVGVGGDDSWINDDPSGVGPLS